MHYQQRIKKYYNDSQWAYRLFFYNQNSLGMHFGFWDKKTKDRHQAMINENKAIADAGGIKKTHRVLDAGCGVGGTAIYIAKNIRARVTGITLVKKQIHLARKYAKDHGVEKLTNFQLQDYTKTNFKSNSFDVVYGIESICHAFPKSSFLNEAYRILKPGGKLVIADGYTKREPKTNQEKKIINDFNKGFSLKELIVVGKMEEQIKKAGFKIIKKTERLKQIKPSVEYFNKLTKNTELITKLTGWIPLSLFSALRNNWLAFFSLNKGIEKKLVTYYLHVGKKPKKKSSRRTAPALRK